MIFPFTQFLPGPANRLLLTGLILLGCFTANNICGQSCPPPSQSLVFINQVTDSTAFVNWSNVSSADSFLIEYSPEGFPPGVGVTETSLLSAVTLDSLNPCVNYDVYLYSICGEEFSDPIGPFSFMTTSPELCTYTFELFDSFGDGWNGASLTVNYNGNDIVYTVGYNPGNMAVFELETFASLPVSISYTPGFFEDEVSFNIKDPSGTIIYSDGPFPETGNIFSFIACGATCPAPKSWIMADVNALNATTSWSLLPGFDSNIFLEYGPMGFMRGTGITATVPTGQTSYTLTGLEEKTWYNLYLGVDCGGDSSKVIGPLIFETLWLNDVGVTSISPNADDFCNLGSGDTITVGLTNFGQVPQTLFEFFYSVNGIPASIPIPQDGLFTGVVGNDSTQFLQFETTWDFSQPGFYVIEAWTQLEGDSEIKNDSFRVEFLNSFPKPIDEDFEDLAIPADWSTDEFFPFYGPGAHNNPTAVFGANLYAGNPELTLTTGRIGPVLAGDTLSFDYRFVNWSAGTDPTELSGQDSLIVQISDDCEETYETVLVIDSTNHVPTTDLTNRIILLDPYDGLTLYVRFLGKWGSGDYWLDLDNIRITGCPVSFGPVLEIEGAFANDNNGIATVIPIGGTAPYTFDWSTNVTTTGDVGVLEDLESGAYFVDITDANGCMETIVFEVGSLVAADEIYGVEAITLYPNPTSGMTNLNIELTSVMDIQTRVMDLSGRIVFEQEYSNIQSLQEQFNLFDQPDGMYIVQIVADGKPYYAKLMLVR